MKLNKKALTWKYIIGAILALIILGVLAWLIFTQGKSMADIVATLGRK